VKNVRVTDKGVLQSPMTLLNRDAKVTGRVVRLQRQSAYVINHNAETP